MKIEMPKVPRPAPFMPAEKKDIEAKMADMARQKAELEEIKKGNKPSWRVVPELPSDDQIVETYDADIVIIGLGHAGTAALRGAIEANPDLKIYALEMMSRETHWAVGHDIGHINSKLLESRGVPHVDEVEFVNNWMVQTQGKANPSLVMQFARNSGAAIDWWVDPCSQELKDAMNITFWPDTPNSIHQLNNGYRYYVGCAQWWTCKSPNNNNSGFETKDIVWANLRLVEKNYPNAILQYGFHGEQLIKNEEGKLVGLIAKNDKGEYVKYNCTRFILSTGGFAANLEMCNDLLPAISGMRSASDGDMGSMILGRDGSGHKMGTWVGGRLESEISTMNFDSAAGPDNFPGLWLDENCERYMNEAFAGPELRGFLTARLKRRDLYSVHDSHMLENVTYSYPGHGSFDPSSESDMAALAWNMYDSYQAGKEGKSANGWRSADTLEELADLLHFDERRKANFLKSIERYNELCDKGVDEDFCKDPRLMHPIKDGPFFVHVGHPRMGSGLVTTGGFVTNNDQVVLDMDYKPIEGLYATGNTCGLRFGSAYITPIPGVSIGMCVTLGKICGENAVKSLAK